jgi:YegS/Rv2252/BmrU family lipid kinase
MRSHFVINPHAGRVNSQARLASAIRAGFEGWDIRVSSQPPRIDESGSGWPDPDLIVAVGGDGTVNRVLNSVVSSGVPLGILPCGTSNDLAHALGIPRNFVRACNIIQQAHLTAIDLVAVNDVFFATCGGIGLPAAVTRRVNRWRQRKLPSYLTTLLGRAVYPLATLCEMLKGTYPVWVSVGTHSGTHAGQWTAVMVSNQPRCGGFSVAPHASNRDGVLELSEIRATHQPSRLFDIVHKAWQGQPENCPEISSRSLHAVSLFTRDAVPFMGDGELLQEGTVFRIKIVPEALRVVVPKTADPMAATTRQLRAESSQETRGRRCG